MDVGYERIKESKGKREGIKLEDLLSPPKTKRASQEAMQGSLNAGAWSKGVQGPEFNS